MTRLFATFVAMAAVARAAVRVGWLEKRSSLPALVARLRSSAAAGPLEKTWIDPGLVLGVVESLLPVLPPYGAGRCVKRSLLLLDVWSRVGLEPSFHLGVRNEGESRSGHAWVTTRNAAVGTFRPPDVEEAWRA